MNLGTVYADTLILGDCNFQYQHGATKHAFQAWWCFALRAASQLLARAVAWFELAWCSLLNSGGPACRHRMSGQRGIAPMIDQWTERLHCVQCDGRGLARLSHVKGAPVPTVERVTGTFRAVQTEYGPDFHCSTCRSRPQLKAHLVPQAYEPWTDKEDYLLLTLKGAGKPVSVIAKQLERTEQSIVSRTAILKRRIVLI